MRLAKLYKPQKTRVEQLHLHAVSKAKINVFDLLYASCCQIFPTVIVDIVLSYNPHISVCLIHYKQNLYKNVFGDVFVGNCYKNEWYKVKKNATQDGFCVDSKIYKSLRLTNLQRESGAACEEFEDDMCHSVLHEEFDGTRLEYRLHGFSTTSLRIYMTAYYSMDICQDFQDAYFDRSRNTLYGVMNKDFSSLQIVNIVPEENIKYRYMNGFRRNWQLRGHLGSKDTEYYFQKGKWGITRNYIVVLSSHTICWICKDDFKFLTTINWNEGNPWCGNDCNIVCFKDEVYFTTNKEMFYMKEPIFDR